MVKGPAEWGACFRTIQLDDSPWRLAHGSNIIAVGLFSGNIIILDAITGSQAAVLCGHTEYVSGIVFSSDGKLLVSGSHDSTVRLWDVQTGGDIREFYNHEAVCHVSISVDCTRIASASLKTVTLWDAQTGGCLLSKEIDHPNIGFSFLHPRVLIILSVELIQWVIDKDAVEPISIGPGIISSLGNALFARHVGQEIIVQGWGSGEIKTQIYISHMYPTGCCFSPDFELVAVSFYGTIHVWNIVGTNPHHIATLCDDPRSVAFSSPSSLISISKNGNSVRFWKIGNLSARPTAINLKSTTFATAPIVSVSLQARDGIVITSNSTGMVEIWDLLTGLQKTSFQTPATGHIQGDGKMINGILRFAWKDCIDHVLIWESGNSAMPMQPGKATNFIVSGDGSQVFLEGFFAIEVWSVWTGKLVGEVDLNAAEYMDPLHAEGSRFWIRSEDLSTKGWGFEIFGSPPTLLFNTPSERPYLDFIHGTKLMTGPCQIKNAVTGKEVFRLAGKYAKPYSIKWDGQYLAADYGNGEVLVLDFGNLCSQ